MCRLIDSIFHAYSRILKGEQILTTTHMEHIFEYCNILNLFGKQHTCIQNIWVWLSGGISRVWIRMALCYEINGDVLFVVVDLLSSIVDSSLCVKRQIWVKHEFTMFLRFFCFVKLLLWTCKYPVICLLIYVTHSRRSIEHVEREKKIFKINVNVIFPQITDLHRKMESKQEIFYYSN